MRLAESFLHQIGVCGLDHIDTAANIVFNQLRIIQMMVLAVGWEIHQVGRPLNLWGHHDRSRSTAGIVHGLVGRVSRKQSVEIQLLGWVISRSIFICQTILRLWLAL